ncbi:hypothetical protein [Nakamurella endophytica]|uniref:hypothetical protein n=1 Tax=Nakamurella endophytica TaxID=1748367 RepID=UPI00166B97CE|nr:hypothetical protein [Nakamurella endophytica]
MAALVLAAGCAEQGSPATTGGSATGSAATVTGTAAMVAGSGGSPTGAAAAVGHGSPHVLPLASDWLADGIHLSVRAAGGAPVTMLVDTGSNGVVISRQYLGDDWSPLQPRQTFSGFTYSSSGMHYSGEWVRTTLQFSSTTDAAGGPATTSPILVRAVDRVCDAHGSCSPSARVAMLGVGFDRGSDNPDSTYSGPAINPFLHLADMDAGQLTPGYVLGSGTVTLGIGQDTADGFRTVGLQRTGGSQSADWAAPSACLAVRGLPAQCGSLLLDTGLPYAIVQVPAGVDPPTTASRTGGRPSVAAGQQIQVGLPALGGAPIYSFTVGGPDAPRSVQWGHNLAENGDSSFFNISRWALSQVDYLYDAGSGALGFRATTPAG